MQGVSVYENGNTEQNSSDSEVVKPSQQGPRIFNY